MTTDPLVGALIGRYRIDRVLGRGGMGRVYLGVHPEIGSRVAIKVLADEWADSKDLLDRFFAEAHTVNLIRHDNIITVIDLDRMPNGRPFIVMEYIAGRSLREVVEAGPAPLGGIVHVMIEVLLALAAAHAAGVVHRDLKPDNVMVTAAGRTKVLDFGIAKLVAAGPRTRTGSALGTPEYMAPEQILGERVDARADLYAAGVMLFELCTGRRPFTGATDYQLMEGHLRGAVPSARVSRPELPDALDAVIAQALAKRADDRFQSATAMAHALRLASADLASTAWQPLVTGDVAAVSFDALPISTEREPPVTHDERGTPNSGGRADAPREGRLDERTRTAPKRDSAPQHADDRANAPRRWDASEVDRANTPTAGATPRHAGERSSDVDRANTPTAGSTPRRPSDVDRANTPTAGATARHANEQSSDVDRANTPTAGATPRHAGERSSDVNRANTPTAGSTPRRPSDVDRANTPTAGATARHANEQSSDVDRANTPTARATRRHAGERSSDVDRANTPTAASTPRHGDARPSDVDRSNTPTAESTSRDDDARPSDVDRANVSTVPATRRQADARAGDVDRANAPTAAPRRSRRGAIVALGAALVIGAGTLVATKVLRHDATALDSSVAVDPRDATGDATTVAQSPDDAPVELRPLGSNVGSPPDLLDAGTVAITSDGGPIGRRGDAGVIAMARDAGVIDRRADAGVIAAGDRDAGTTHAGQTITAAHGPSAHAGWEPDKVWGFDPPIMTEQATGKRFQTFQHELGVDPATFDEGAYAATALRIVRELEPDAVLTGFDTFLDGNGQVTKSKRSDAGYGRMWFRSPAAAAANAPGRLACIFAFPGFGGLRVERVGECTGGPAVSLPHCHVADVLGKVAHKDGNVARIDVAYGSTGWRVMQWQPGDDDSDARTRQRLTEKVADDCSR